MTTTPDCNARNLLKKGWLLEYHCREWSAALQEMPYEAREFYDYGHIETKGANRLSVCFYCHEYLLRDEDGRLFVAAGDFTIHEEPW